MSAPQDPLRARARSFIEAAMDAFLSPAQQKHRANWLAEYEAALEHVPAVVMDAIARAAQSPRQDGPGLRAIEGVRTWMVQGSHELVARDEVLAALPRQDEPGLREALSTYGHHTIDCRWEKADCTCGWDTFLADYDAALPAEPPKEQLDVERLARAVSNVEWAWMENEGRFPAPDATTYERGLREQLHAMSEVERRAGPMSNPAIAAEYDRLGSE